MVNPSSLTMAPTGADTCLLVGYRYHQAPRQEGQPHRARQRGPVPPSVGQGGTFRLKLSLNSPIDNSLSSALPIPCPQDGQLI